MSVCYSALKYDEIIMDHKPIEIKRFHGFIHPIQEFLNTNIDLDSVSRITNAYHVDKMGYGGHFVAFDIISQKNEPIFEFMCEVGTKYAIVPKEEYERFGGNYPYLKIEENYYKSVYHIQETVDAIQEKIVDDIVKVWCLYKEQEKGWGDLDEKTK